ncbi:YhbY family RNA-binding protein [Thiohalobacter thiocyanaticus]|uniref:YhbY family RNA-binding protein n=1 Tax=Thiohalobacter thiocyanaticus TaxID=585455 RepID=A0A426QMI6_9GAMM|nr:YhbY family RNA-binding protein [Thiohalobacter thiocyanaticus]RRQ22972.1 YhbY family RNA-binding protein [Thiohalobacter thiocyanaticus]
MNLTQAQLRHLRGLGHKLKPVVTVGGKGLTESVIEEIDSSVNHHELMKIKLNVGDRDVRDQLLEELCQRLELRLIQRVGNTALVFRRNPDRPRVALQ